MLGAVGIIDAERHHYAGDAQCTDNASAMNRQALSLSWSSLVGSQAMASRLHWLVVGNPLEHDNLQTH